MTGAGVTPGSPPTSLALRAVSRVPLTRHATDGAAPVSDADGVPVSEAAGVAAGPDLAATLALVTGFGLIVGGLAGAIAAGATPD